MDLFFDTYIRVFHSANFFFLIVYLRTVHIHSTKSYIFKVHTHIYKINKSKINNKVVRWLVEEPVHHKAKYRIKCVSERVLVNQMHICRYT